MATKVLGELPKELEERAQRLHKDAFIVDGLMNKGSVTGRDWVEDAAQGLNGAYITVVNFKEDFRGSVDEITKHKRYIQEEFADRLAFCTTADDFLNARQQGKMGVAMGFQDTKPVGDQLDRVRFFYDLGIRGMQLTYNMQNWVGSGCCERHDGPLSTFGLQLMEELEYQGIMVDLSHCGDATTLDALRHAKKPPAFTHVGVRALCNAYGRNKTDEMFKLLGEKGGVAGITFFPAFVKRNNITHEVLLSTVEDVLDAVDHVVRLIGVDHVVFGSDMSSKWLDLGQATPTSVLRFFRKEYPHVFGVGSTEKYEPFPEGLERHKLSINLTRGLVARGYSDEDVPKILGGNWLRYYREVWK